MKVGQALSVMEAAVPEQFGEPYREALTKLQKDAPPLPAAKVHRVLDAQLGTKWRDRFSSFDDEPDRVGQHRPGAQGRVVRRPRGRRQDPVPRRRRGPARRPEDDEAHGVGVQAARPRRRHPGRRRRTDRTHRDGAGLPARGRESARLRQGLQGPPALRRARDRRQRPQGGHRGVDGRHPAGEDHPRGHRRAARPDGHAAVRAHLRRAAPARDDARRRASRELHAAARRQDGRHRLRCRRPDARRHPRSNSA